MGYFGVPGFPSNAFCAAIRGIPEAMIPCLEAGDAKFRKSTDMMDIQRFVLFIVFSFSLLLLWEAWQKEQRPPVQASVAAQQKAAGTPAANTPPAAASPAKPVPTGAANSVALKGERLTVRTDKLRVEIDTAGGEIVRLELLEHPDSENRERNVELLGAEYHYSVQSGLIGEGWPNHRTLYTAAASSYELQAGQESLEVVLEAKAAGAATGAVLRKIYRFHRGSYIADLEFEVRNGSPSVVTPDLYVQLVRDGKSPPTTSGMSSTYTGPALYTEQDKFKKLAFGDVDEKGFSKTADNGWIAMLQHYFVVALVPVQGQQREFFTRKLDNELFASGVIQSMSAVAPGAVASSRVAVYAGPQEQDKLRAIAPGLDLVVDYGWLTVIAAPLFWILQFFHGLSANWGLAIILLTVSIKLVFFPLSAASYRSMAKMKQVTPRLMKIREQYADDRMKQNQAMMELYKQEKINPLGGCLPIVVQIPVFIALYWVLLASVELREAPFYGWITDLSAKDPYYILPVLMMASMIVQTRMSPMPPDPVQAKVMQIMPLVFGVMFFVFPSGLVLYWLVNNILSILQQWYITRHLEAR